MSKKFTYADVAVHSKRDDLYLIYREKVYDATKFLDDHPGGEEVLLDVAGQDVTEAFEDVGHSVDALAILEGLAIGTLNLSGGGPVAKTQKKGTSTQSESSHSFFYALVIFGVVSSFGVYKYLRL